MCIRSVSCMFILFIFFFFNDTATTEIYTLSLHDALPTYGPQQGPPSGSSIALVRRRSPPPPQPHLGHAAGGAGSRARLAPGTVTVPLCSQTKASPFWIMLLLVLGRLDNGMIRIRQPDRE